MSYKVLIPITLFLLFLFSIALFYFQTPAIIKIKAWLSNNLSGTILTLAGIVTLIATQINSSKSDQTQSEIVSTGNRIEKLSQDNQSLSQKNIELAEENRKLSKNLNATYSQLAAKSQQIIEQGELLQKANLEIQHHQENAIRYLSGSENLPKISPMFTGRELIIIVSNIDEIYPIRNFKATTINFIQMDRQRKIPTMSGLDARLQSTHIFPPNGALDLQPGEDLTIATIPIPEGFGPGRVAYIDIQCLAGRVERVINLVRHPSGGLEVEDRMKFLSEVQPYRKGDRGFTQPKNKDTYYFKKGSSEE